MKHKKIIDGEPVWYDSKADRAKYEKEWRKSHPDCNHQRLSEVVKDPKTDLKVGDSVIFTNDYGVKFLLNVIGFTTPNQFGRCVYLNFDCHWFAEYPEKLQKVNIEF